MALCGTVRDEESLEALSEKGAVLCAIKLSRLRNTASRNWLAVWVGANAALPASVLPKAHVWALPTPANLLPSIKESWNPCNMSAQMCAGAVGVAASRLIHRPPCLCSVVLAAFCCNSPVSLALGSATLDAPCTAASPVDHS